MIVYGGIDSRQRHLNDVWIFDLCNISLFNKVVKETYKWQLAEMEKNSVIHLNGVAFH